MKPPAFTISFLAALASFAASGSGPAIGTRFPDAKLTLGSKGAAILVGGSAAQTAEFDRHRQAFEKLGVGVTELKALPGGSAGCGWFILSPKRIVAAKYFQPGECYTSAAILVHRFGWTPPDLAPVQGKQLTASVGASNSIVSPGERVALVIDIELEPNMHVYAPGVEGYIPIDWKMESSAAADVHAPEFPKAEKLYLKAIDETVPAYRDHFRLIRDVTINGSTSTPVNLDGVLRYQACDDRVCYIPQTLHLNWTFRTPDSSQGQ
jgi:hypothetical protein